MLRVGSVLGIALVVAAALLIRLGLDVKDGSTDVLFLGDANCSGETDAIDAAVILQFVAGRIPSADCPDEADVNDSGAVDAIDAALVLQFGAGLIPTKVPATTPTPSPTDTPTSPPPPPSATATPSAAPSETPVPADTPTLTPSGPPTPTYTPTPTPTPMLLVNGQLSSERLQNSGYFEMTGEGFTPGVEIERYQILPIGTAHKISGAIADKSGSVRFPFYFWPNCDNLVGKRTIWMLDPILGQSNTVSETIHLNPGCGLLPTSTQVPPDGTPRAPTLLVDRELSNTRGQGEGSFLVTGTKYTPNSVVMRYRQYPGEKATLDTTIADDNGGIAFGRFWPGCEDPTGKFTEWVVDGILGPSNTVSQTVTEDLEECP